MRDNRFLAVVMVVVVLLLFQQTGLAIIFAILAGIVIISRKLDQHEGDLPPPESKLPQRKGKYVSIKSTGRQTPPPK